MARFMQEDTYRGGLADPLSLGLKPEPDPRQPGNYNSGSNYKNVTGSGSGSSGSGGTPVANPRVDVSPASSVPNIQAVQSKATNEMLKAQNTYLSFTLNSFMGDPGWSNSYLPINGRQIAGQRPGAYGYGGIYDTLAYLNDKYGSGWASSGVWGSLEAKVPDFTMANISPDKNICTLIAIMRVFAYYRDTGSSGAFIPVPDNAALYQNIKEIAGGAMIRYTELWGTNVFLIDDIVRRLTAQYSLDGAGKSSFSVSFEKMKVEIDAGRPVVLNIAAGYYGRHSVTVIGYCEFARGSDDSLETKQFLKVFDGWENKTEPRYIDMSLFPRPASMTTIIFNK